MTDKQIIINDVDVSECEYIHLLPDNYCGMDYACTCNLGNCRENPNCYYKQLKRKEQECESLKSAFSLDTKMLEQTERRESDLEKQLDQLKAENDELKKKLTIAEDNFACEMQAHLYHLNEWLKISKENDDCKKRLNELSVFNKKIIDEKFKIACQSTKRKQALDEIEEYLKTLLDANGNDVYSMVQNAIRKISNIINKAKDGE